MSTGPSPAPVRAQRDPLLVRRRHIDLRHTDSQLCRRG